MTQLRGEATSLIGLRMNISSDQVTVSVTGPSNVWFGVGFFAQVSARIIYVGKSQSCMV